MIGARLEAIGIESRPDTGARRRELLDVGCVTDQTRPLDEVLRRRIIGQEEAIQALTCKFSRMWSGLRDPSRPALTALLLGPTGVGKTETARALAHALFGSEHGLTQVNAEEYAHGHELAKLLGSPPGYVGHQIEPILSQRRIDEAHRVAIENHTGMVGEAGSRPRADARNNPLDGSYLSVILFDEIEKAHPLLWNALLGILEDGRLTLGDNTVVDFTHSIIVMTSNVGSQDMDAELEHRPVGFRAALGPDIGEHHSITQTALAAAHHTFPPEFLNRFDEILAYAPLDVEGLERIFQKFLADIHVRALQQAGVPLLIKVSPEARRFIIERGTNLTLGARPLRRAIEAELVDPLARLIGGLQVNAGDVIEVEREGDRLAFYRTLSSDGALVVG